MNTFTKIIITSILLSFGFGAESSDDVENQNHHASLERSTKMPIIVNNLLEITISRIQELFSTPIMKEYACQTLSTVTGGIILYGLYYSFGLSQQHE
ncbi:MAG: hypothetical protein ACK4V2_00445 [Pseudomonadota bacterium]|jgi:hypothetical protein|nr:hypothetical protein [Alphaproteobacteria bacterium]